MTENIKLYIAMHKKSPLPKDIKHYYPIQVGAAHKQKFLSLCDDVGDNISLKNDRYCELTALYWIWKNALNSDYIGLCHYRRYYNFKGENDDCRAIYEYTYTFNNHFPNSVIEKIDFADIIPQILSSCDIILPKPEKIKFNIKTQYELCHSKEDLNVLKNVLIRKYPQYEHAWDTTMDKNTMSICNMFITNKEKFNLYATWLFDILFEVEKHIPPKQDLYQNRTFGFMAERLLNVYVNYHNYSVKYLPIIFLERKYDRLKSNIKKEIREVVSHDHKYE